MDEPRTPYENALADTLRDLVTYYHFAELACGKDVARTVFDRIGKGLSLRQAYIATRSIAPATQDEQDEVDLLCPETKDLVRRLPLDKELEALRDKRNVYQEWSDRLRRATKEPRGRTRE